MSHSFENASSANHQHLPLDDGEVDVVVDLEECSREHRRPPKTRKGYRVKINGEAFVILCPVVTGREVLEIANLPPQKYKLWLKARGERPRKIGLDEKVDLTQPGIEKFKALPCDQTEG